MENKEMELPVSKKTAVIKEFKGKHIREAQRIGGDDTGKMLFAMIALCVEVDGKPVTMEDLDEMPGMDVLTLQKEFSGANF